MPNPANITFAGENTYQTYMSGQILDKFMFRGVPDRRPLREWKKGRRERLSSDQAILTTVHQLFGTDLARGLDAEGLQEWHWENCKIGALRRVDVRVGRSSCASCIRPRHY